MSQAFTLQFLTRRDTYIDVTPHPVPISRKVWLELTHLSTFVVSHADPANMAGEKTKGRTEYSLA